jgi:hypothetical protein
MISEGWTISAKERKGAWKNDDRHSEICGFVPTTSVAAIHSPIARPHRAFSGRYIDPQRRPARARLKRRWHFLHDPTKLAAFDMHLNAELPSENTK